MSDNNTIRVLEDNAGGIHLTDGGLVLSHFEEQRQPGGLLNDITNWDLCADNAPDARTYAACAATMEHPSTKVIAEHDGETIRIYPSSMGNAGRHYAGITVV